MIPGPAGVPEPTRRSSPPRAGWEILDAARRRSYSGELILGTTPVAHVFLDRGEVYLAECEGDAPIGSRLVDSGALGEAELANGTVEVLGVGDLGRLFERVPTVDRDVVLVALEVMSGATLAWAAAQPLDSVTSRPYVFHPSGVHRWSRVPNGAFAVHLSGTPSRGAVVLPAPSPSERLDGPPAGWDATAAPRPDAPADAAASSRGAAGPSGGALVAGARSSDEVAGAVGTPAANGEQAVPSADDRVAPSDAGNRAPPPADAAPQVGLDPADRVSDGTPRIARSSGVPSGAPLDGPYDESYIDWLEVDLAPTDIGPASSLSRAPWAGEADLAHFDLHWPSGDVGVPFLADPPADAVPVTSSSLSAIGVPPAGDLPDGRDTGRVPPRRAVRDPGRATGPDVRSGTELVDGDDPHDPDPDPASTERLRQAVRSTIVAIEEGMLLGEPDGTVLVDDVFLASGSGPGAGSGLGAGSGPAGSGPAGSGPAGSGPARSGSGGSGSGGSGLGGAVDGLVDPPDRWSGVVDESPLGSESGRVEARHGHLSSRIGAGTFTDDDRRTALARLIDSLRRR